MPYPLLLHTVQCQEGPTRLVQEGGGAVLVLKGAYGRIWVRRYGTVRQETVAWSKEEVAFVSGRRTVGAIIWRGGAREMQVQGIRWGKRVGFVFLVTGADLFSNVRLGVARRTRGVPLH